MRRDGVIRRLALVVSFALFSVAAAWAGTEQPASSRLVDRTLVCRMPGVGYPDPSRFMTFSAVNGRAAVVSASNGPDYEVRATVATGPIGRERSGHVALNRETCIGTKPPLPADFDPTPQRRPRGRVRQDIRVRRADEGARTSPGDLQTRHWIRPRPRCADADPRTRADPVRLDRDRLPRSHADRSCVGRRQDREDADLRRPVPLCTDAIAAVNASRRGPTRSTRRRGGRCGGSRGARGGRRGGVRCARGSPGRGRDGR
jgi:hypothetical protein